MRCLCEYGDFETSDGNTVVLTKNSTVSNKKSVLYVNLFSFNYIHEFMCNFNYLQDLSKSKSI